MVTISIQADVKRATAALNDIAKRQIGFATAQAINEIAFHVQRTERANITSVFSSPRPFTQNSVFVDKASKNNPVATIFVRPEVSRYLLPYEFGGAHVLPGRALLDPVNARLDQFGQLPKGAVQRMLARPDTFAGTIHGVKGIWQRVAVTKVARGRAKRMGQAIAQHVKLLIRFGDALPVTKQLHFGSTAAATVKSNFRGAFNSALARAIASSLK